MEAKIGIQWAESPAPPAPLPEDDQGIETHQEVPVGATMTATSDYIPTRHIITIPTAVQSTSRDRPISTSFVPQSLSTPRAPKRRAALLKVGV